MSSLEEQETIINFGRLDTKAEIYTSDTRMITKLDKLYPVIKSVYCQGELVARVYEADVKSISFRSTKKTEVSQEKRDALRERMKKIWETKRNKKEEDAQ